MPHELTGEDGLSLFSRVVFMHWCSLVCVFGVCIVTRVCARASVPALVRGCLRWTRRGERAESQREPERARESQREPERARESQREERREKEKERYGVQTSPSQERCWNLVDATRAPCHTHRLGHSAKRLAVWATLLFSWLAGIWHLTKVQQNKVKSRACKVAA